PAAMSRRRSPFAITAWVVVGILVVCCVVQVVSSLFALQAINGVMAKYAGPLQTVTLFYSRLQNQKYEDARALLAPGLASQHTADSLHTQWELFQAGRKVTVSSL